MTRPRKILLLPLYLLRCGWLKFPLILSLIIGILSFPGFFSGSSDIKSAQAEILGAVQQVGTRDLLLVLTSQHAEQITPGVPFSSFTLGDDNQHQTDDQQTDRSIRRCLHCVLNPIQHASQLFPYQKTAPWPSDEYICDGGDGQFRSKVKPDRSVIGLEIEDTIAHFDTLDGRTLVAPTRRVCIYAPRFASARKISGIAENQQHEQMVEFEAPLQPSVDTDTVIATTVLQRTQPRGQIGRRPVNLFREQLRVRTVFRPRQIGTLREGILPHEASPVIQYGEYGQAENYQLAQSIEAAQTWSHPVGVQVVIDATQPVAETAYEHTGVLYKLDPQGKAQLCVVKVASKQSALPGDLIHFTLRYDNTGNEQLQNITLLDNLSPRLEYVPQSAESSLKADFSTQANSVESLVLRWEIKEPLQPGQGGLIRFQCRVR
ncbi:MAG: hypothetical protein CMJ81_04565 [Planctomycetaceae bacterium]|nr:hypothetical protein [Planctomycetaceae bacterium]MBP63692.1 hypothetical protein [Planctomycetaceae bacterium]